MEEMKHKCKLCWKSFLNGRALGGHMRSHMLLHPFPSKLDSHPESASSSMPDPGESETESSKKPSETESSKKPTRKRSRLNRRSINVSLRQQQSKEEEKSETATEIKTTMKIMRQEVSESCTEQEPLSSVSDAAIEEEDVAFSLMMLSRDKWEEEEESDDEGWESRKKHKALFECETCGKVFKSYQALGGHRASHKKKKALEASSSYMTDEKTKKKSSSSIGHECPICLKVFSSGQALGGHKRSHAATGPESSPMKRGMIGLIDLNLPAPSEEEDLVSSVFNS